ncbi:peroxidase 21 [Senna tora]|uniref:Peroxidase n=1 Tax=Senna tora TaxID=362788 RepID=A0A834WF32_9FABA|nr:peroxidase 21 [Senna tora]
MATTTKSPSHFTSLLLLLLISHFNLGKSQLELNYYATSCPRAEEIIKQQVVQLYYKHGNTAVSWVRNLFHDCMVKTSARSFGMRNFKYVDTIKAAVEVECPSTVSCADIVALSARDGILMLGGPRIEVKTGRRDSTESFVSVVEDYIPNHNDSMSLVLSRFQSLGIDVEAAVALLGTYKLTLNSNIHFRLYPTVDPTLDPDYAVYLKGRCPTPNPDPTAVLYARNDRETPMLLDNFYFKNILKHKGLLRVDEFLATDPRTSPYVQKMAADNAYFYQQFSRAILLLSEINPLTGHQGQIRKDCRYVNPLSP